MRSNILISVVVPIYNVEKYLSECIDSILEQTYKNLEIILVDDGSTDSSGIIADEYSKQDNRIIVKHKNNEGIVATRKFGVKMASGDYITFVDSDDWIEADMYDSLLKSVDYSVVDMITSGLYREYGEHSVFEKDEIPEGFYDHKQIEKEVFPTAIYTGSFFSSGINIHLYNKLFRADILKNVSERIDNKINVGDDAAFVYGSLYRCKNIKILSTGFYHYRIREGSCMDSKKDDEAESLEKLKSFLMSIEVPSSIESQYINSVDKIHKYLCMLQIPEYIIKEENGHIYPFGKLQKKQIIILYGAGRLGEKIKNILEKRYDIKIKAISDKNYKNIQDDYRIVPKRIIDIPNDEYDYILISILKENLSSDVKNNLINEGISEEKIIEINKQLAL